MSSVNPERGCGKLKKGGFYLQSEMAPGGTLHPLTWTLGSHLLQSGYSLNDNVFTNAAPRSMTLINPAATFLKGDIIPAGNEVFIEDSGQQDLYSDLVRAIGNVGLLDHVGKVHYDTPWRFAQEVLKHGPSRKVPEKLVKNLSDNNMFPIPIFFAHSRMPFFSSFFARDFVFEQSCKFLNEDSTDDRWSMKPTWFNAGEGWGNTIKHDDHGENHYMVPVLKTWSYFPVEAVAEAKRDKTLYEESVFAASWITRGAYVLTDENDPGISGKGLVNIDIDLEIIYESEER